MSVATTSFFSTYAQLISLATDAPADTFYGTDDYSKLESLGPTLPRLPYALPDRNSDTLTSEHVVTINVKSIKPPYKFSTQLKGVPVGQSIYKIKTKLVEEVDVLRNAGASAGDLKIMIKAKVLSDSTVLSSLVSGDVDLAFTVMVSAPAKSKSEPPVEVPATHTVSEATWNKIYELLSCDIGAHDARAMVEKFKGIQ